MNEQSTSFLKRRFDFPSLEEGVYILRTIPFWEKLLFLILGLVFMVSTLILVWEVNKRLLVVVPEEGGTITEGVVGTPRFINPLIAISDADRDLVSLVYSGLMRADNSGGLTTDLAEKYEVSEDGLVYTFTLKNDLLWQDKEKITTDDVVFTIQRAKDPVLKSTKRAAWEGVEVEKVDDMVVRFNLKKPYSPFLENLTLGILPQHIWQSIPSEQMLYSEINTNPIGSGPYKIDGITRNQSGNVNAYTLVPNKEFALGKPYLKQITLKFFLSERDAIEAYKKNQVTSIGGISPANIGEFIKDCSTDTKCVSYKNQIKTADLPRVFAVFFNQNKSKILLQKEVRQALLTATNKDELVQEVLKGYGKTLQHPIPQGTLGAIEKEQEIASIDEAKKILAKNGWKLDQDGIFEKTLSKQETIKLEFSISTSGESEELKNTANLLKKMWESVGAKVDIKFFEAGDLQKAIAERNYESLLFGESIGHDPDPFVFWHSSQKNYPGSNVALYTNTKVDKLLEDARKTLNTEERISKYKNFQEEVQKDIPAVFLFSPSFIYVLPNNIQGAESILNVTTSSERFSQVYKWYTQTNKVWRFFAK